MESVEDQAFGLSNGYHKQWNAETMFVARTLKVRSALKDFIQVQVLQSSSVTPFPYLSSCPWVRQCFKRSRRNGTFYKFGFMQLAWCVIRIWENCACLRMQNDGTEHIDRYIYIYILIIFIYKRCSNSFRYLNSFEGGYVSVWGDISKDSSKWSSIIQKPTIQTVWENCWELFYGYMFMVASSDLSCCLLDGSIWFQHVPSRCPRLANGASCCIPSGLMRAWIAF